MADLNETLPLYANELKKGQEESLEKSSRVPPATYVPITVAGVVVLVIASFFFVNYLRKESTDQGEGEGEAAQAVTNRKTDNSDRRKIQKTKRAAPAKQRGLRTVPTNERADFGESTAVFETIDSNVRSNVTVISELNRSGAVQGNTSRINLDGALEGKKFEDSSETVSSTSDTKDKDNASDLANKDDQAKASFSNVSNQGGYWNQSNMDIKSTENVLNTGASDGNLATSDAPGSKTSLNSNASANLATDNATASKADSKTSLNSTSAANESPSKESLQPTNVTAKASASNTALNTLAADDEDQANTEENDAGNVEENDAGNVEENDAGNVEENE